MKKIIESILIEYCSRCNLTLFAAMTLKMRGGKKLNKAIKVRNRNYSSRFAWDQRRHDSSYATNSFSLPAASQWTLNISVNRFAASQ